MQNSRADQDAVWDVYSGVQGTRILPREGGIFLEDVAARAARGDAASCWHTVAACDYYGVYVGGVEL